MTHDEHTLKRFDTELAEIRSRILTMGGLVEIQLESMGSDSIDFKLFRLPISTFDIWLNPPL